MFTPTSIRLSITERVLILPTIASQTTPRHPIFHFLHILNVFPAPGRFPQVCKMPNLRPLSITTLGSMNCLTLSFIRRKTFAKLDTKRLLNALLSFDQYETSLSCCEKIVHTKGSVYVGKYYHTGIIVNYGKYGKELF